MNTNITHPYTHSTFRGGCAVFRVKAHHFTTKKKIFSFTKNSLCVQIVCILFTGEIYSRGQSGGGPPTGSGPTGGMPPTGPTNSSSKTGSDYSYGAGYGMCFVLLYEFHKFCG